MALYTAVPGILAYAAPRRHPHRRHAFQSRGARVSSGSDAPSSTRLVLLPAFGLVYAVGVAHVLGPRVVLRRSLQYALANRSLTVLIFLPAIALVFSLVRERDRTIAQIASSSSALYVVLIARFGRHVHEARARPAMAGSTLLPRRVRRAQDPAVARQPRALRNRSDGSGDDGRQPARRGAPSADDGDPRERHRRGHADAGHGPARKRRAAAARGRPGVDAALVGRSARDRPQRSALAGAPAAAERAGVAGLHRRRAARAGRRRGSLADCRHRAWRTAFGGGVHRRGSPAARQHRGADGARASTSCACAGESAATPRSTAIARTSEAPPSPRSSR